MKPIAGTTAVLKRQASKASRATLASLAALAALTALSGCVIIQDGYDQEAMRSCNDIANAEDRMICERAVLDAQYERRQEALREN